MNLKYNKKLKTAVIASALALAITSPVLASSGINDNDHVSWIDHDLNGAFEISLGSQSASGGGYIARYLYYTPTDRTIVTNRETVTLKGGQYYILTEYESDAGGYQDFTFTTIGPATMSEDELKQAIDDAIHNIDGDQTVDGNQTVTGSQDVQGGPVSGALLIFKQAVKI